MGKTRLIQLWVSALFLSIITNDARGQFIGFELRNDRRSWSFPFENFNNLIVVPVTLNHTLPLKFILDTGVRTTILTDRTISDLINISYERSVTIFGAGHARELNAYVASNISLSLPGIEGRGQSLIVLEEDYLELRDHLGANVHGILGYEFFNAFVVDIDYAHNKVIISEPATYKPPRNYLGLNFEIIQARPYVPATIIQANGKSFEGKFLIDTGASHAMLVEYDSHEDIYEPPNQFEAIIGRGLSGDIYGFFSRLKGIKFGPFEFSEVLSSFTSNYTDSLITELTRRNGSIGGDLLSRFNIIIDYSRQKIYLRKNSSFKEPFEFNMSGLDIVAKGAEFEKKVILKVITDSPAYDTGIMPGDVLVSLNGIPSRDLSLSEVNYILRSKPERKVSIVVERNGLKFRYKFRLKRLV